MTDRRSIKTVAGRARVVSGQLGGKAVKGADAAVSQSRKTAEQAFKKLKAARVKAAKSLS